MSIGSTLREARECAGLTLADASERTSMRRTLISAIERDDFTLCGGEVYARGHIRSLSRVAGINSDPLIDEFDALYGNPSESIVDLIDSSPILIKPHRSPWQPAMAVAGLALFIIAGIAIAQGDSEGEPVVAQPTQSASPSTPSAPGPTTSEPDALADAGDGVTFGVVAVNGASWLSVRDSNGQQLFQGIIQKGARRTFTDDTNLKVVIGNAGGLEISINGRDFGVAGASGAVVRFDLKPGDPGIG